MIEVFNIKEGLFFGVLNLNEYANSLDLTAKRDIETSGKNHLIQQLLDKEAEIAYDEKGKLN